MTAIDLDRRSAIGLTAAALTGLGLPTLAQTRPPRVFMITFRGETRVERGFREHIAQSGVPIELIHRDVDRDMSRLPALIREIRETKPDLVYTWGTPVTLGVVGPYDAIDPSRHITDIPVVFALVSAPVLAKIVPSMDKPGRNVTGAVHVVPTDVQLRVMHSYRPIAGIGVIYTAAEPNSVAIAGEVKQFCAANKHLFIERVFRTDPAGRPLVDGIEDYIEDIRRAGANWIYFLPDTFLGSQAARYIPAATKARLPSFGAAEFAVREAGSIAGLVARYDSVGQLAAVKCLQILVERRPAASIPVEMLKRFSLIINMKVARELEIYPPISMLNYAEILTS